MSRATRFLLCSAVLWNLALCVHAQQAAGAPARPQPQAQTQPQVQGDAAADLAYRQLIEQALSEVNLGHWAEARSLFMRAHQQRPSARTLRGIAVTAFELRDYVEALAAARGAQQDKSQPLTAEQQTEMANLIETSLRFVGHYTIDAVPVPERIVVDGLARALDTDRGLQLAVGTHTLQAYASGYEPAQVSIEVVGGEQRVLSLRLAPSDTEARALASKPARVSSDEGSTSWPIGPVIVTSLGVAAVIAGTITGVLALDRAGQLHDACADHKQDCPPEYQADKRAADHLAVATDALWIGGGVVAAAGVTWWLIASAHGAQSANDQQPSAFLQVDRHGAALHLRGQF